MFWRTFRWGNSAKFCQTSRVLRLCTGNAEMSWPRRNSRPLDIDSRPATMRRSVVLPQPLGPMMATNSPRSMDKSTCSSATKSPKFLAMPRSSRSTCDREMSETAFMPIAALGANRRTPPMAPAGTLPSALAGLELVVDRNPGLVRLLHRQAARHALVDERLDQHFSRILRIGNVAHQLGLLLVPELRDLHVRGARLEALGVDQLGLHAGAAHVLDPLKRQFLVLAVGAEGSRLAPADAAFVRHGRGEVLVPGADQGDFHVTGRRHPGIFVDQRIDQALILLAEHADLRAQLEQPLLHLGELGIGNIVRCLVVRLYRQTGIAHVRQVPVEQRHLAL